MLPIAYVALVLAATGDPDPLVLETVVDVWDVTWGDLNGDGRPDIVAYCSDATAAAPAKELAIFLADETGRYPSSPDIRFGLPPTNGAVFLCEFDGSPPMEIVEAQQDRAVVGRLDAGAFSVVDVIEFDSLLPSSSREPVFARNIPVDLDGDGADEWLVPTPRGVSIFTGGRLRAEIPSPTSSEIKEWGNLAILHRLPAITNFPLPGEPLRAVALLSDRYADFSYGAEWAYHYRFAIPARNEESWDATAVLQDINADGVPDLIVTQTAGTVSLEVTTQIYFADAAFRYPDKPDSEFHTKGSFTTVEVEDVDGDGSLDLILVRIPLGVKNIINYLFRKRVTVEVAVHHFREGSFGDKPDRTSNITIDAPDGRERSAYATGDFNGDGRLDVAIGTNEEKLAVFHGSDDAFLGSRPAVTFSLPTFGVARTHDLNGNGADDLILHHPSGPHQRRIEIILF